MDMDMDMDMDMHADMHVDMPSHQHHLPRRARADVSHLEAEWTCSDVAPWSSLPLSCDWAVGSFAGGDDVMAWERASAQGRHHFDCAECLSDGAIYFASIRCVDQVGRSSALPPSCQALYLPLVLYPACRLPMYNQRRPSTFPTCHLPACLPDHCPPARCHLLLLPTSSLAYLPDGMGDARTYTCIYICKLSCMCMHTWVYLPGGMDHALIVIRPHARSHPAGGVPRRRRRVAHDWAHVILLGLCRAARPHLGL